MSKPDTEMTVTGFLAGKLKEIAMDDMNGDAPLQWQERVVLSKAIHDLHRIEKEKSPEK